MIIERLKTGEVHTLKLVTGEEVITRLTDVGETTYKVYKPLVLSVTQTGVAMTPFLFTAEIEGNIDIPKTAVIALAITDRDTANQYIKGTSSIVPASATKFSKLI
jgi:hypothetical protein